MRHGTRLVWARTLALLVALGLGFADLPSRAADSAAPLAGVVNINTATSEELQLLPGIGVSRAQSVIATRKQRGGFKSVDDLLEVKGIGAASLERLRPFVRTTGKTTVQID